MKILDLKNVNKSFSSEYGDLEVLKDINLEVNKGEIVALIGPSGSGKTKIAGRLLDATDKFVKLKSYTTKDDTSLKENDWYNYITFDEFHRMCDNDELFESTMFFVADAFF